MQNIAKELYQYLYMFLEQFIKEWKGNGLSIKGGF